LSANFQVGKEKSDVVRLGEKAWGRKKRSRLLPGCRKKGNLHVGKKPGNRIWKTMVKKKPSSKLCLQKDLFLKKKG